MFVAHMTADIAHISINQAPESMRPKRSPMPPAMSWRPLSLWGATGEGRNWVVLSPVVLLWQGAKRNASQVRERNAVQVDEQRTWSIR